MGDDRQTFTDPETGEEVESTKLARWSIVFGWILFGGVLFGLFAGFYGELTSGLGLGLFLSLLMGILMVLRLPNVKAVRSDLFHRSIHDPIARWQHRRRILRGQEHQAVPDTAISRAQPPGEPQATDAALSIADDHDEPGHLTVEIEEDTEDQVPISR